MTDQAPPARALLIEVRWPDGRFHGVREGRSRDGREVVAAEWPPSPFRLFQALVAGAYGGRWAAEPAAPKDAAFEWLERQAAPAIVAPPADRLQPVTYFVPNNDLDTRGGDPARVGEIRSAKVVRTSAFDPERPAAYLWRFEGDEGPARQLSELALRLHTLGHGIDAAYAHAEVLDAEAAEARLAELGGAAMRPAPGPPQDGETPSPCPAPGSLDSLRRRHAAFGQRLERVGSGRRAAALFSQPPKPHARAVVYARSPERLLLELRPVAGADAFAPWPLEDAYGLTTAVRDLMALNLGGGEERVQRFVVGRTAGAKDGARRVRILPLPSIGHAYTDPRIRRVLVERPADCPVALQEIAWALAGRRLGLTPPDAVGPPLLVRGEDFAMARFYGVPPSQPEGARAFKRWRTVTPAVLPEAAARRRLDPDRLAAEASARRPLSASADPGGEVKDGRERAQEEARAIAQVRRALDHAGVPAAAGEVWVQREPFHPRWLRAEPFAAGRFPKERLWHVQVEFDRPTTGPLAIGDGRFCGLGVMAPVRMAAASPDLFAFQLTSDAPLPAGAGPALVQAVRRALMARAREVGALELFSGHAADGAPARSGAHRHAYLALLGEAAPTLWVVAPWRVDRSWTEPQGSALRQGFRRVVEGLATVRAGRLGLLRLEPADGAAIAASARTWVAATPYRLNRYVRRGGDAGTSAVEDLQTACVRLGRPRPQVELIGEVAGGAVRARLRFPRRVAGPLLIGRDAHAGGGLFLPERGAGRAGGA